MARFPDSFLDDLRARVRVSEVVSRKVVLKRVGSEYVGISPFNKEDSASFTVNDEKQFWHDFSAHKHGDVFAFEMETTGCDFVEAVERIAAIAHVPLPAEDRRRTPLAPSTSGPPPFDPDDPGAQPDDRGAQPTPSKRSITKTYDYTDRQGNLLYQVCRMEWEENGKRKKTFIQRRPSPDGDGSWIWGLSAGEFLRSRSGDWYQATKERIEKWQGAQRRTFREGAEHGLYRLVEFSEEASPDEPVFILEGEKDTDTARSWGLIATTNSGGARHWRAEHAEFFRGLDVVIPLDNDEAGRSRAGIVGATLRGIAKRVRVLDWADVWRDAPKGADLTDWAQQAGGTRERLLELIPRLPDWRPPPFISQFGGLPFERLDDPGPEHEYLIDDILTLGDKSAIGGASRSGKSFLAIEAAGCIATGKDFFGHKIMAPGLVIYQAGEGATGIKKRFRAWRQWNGWEPGRRLPIYLLQSRIDIYRPDGDTAKLIEEIKGIQAQYQEQLRVLFIDTLAKAQGAADENNGKDMSLVMANIDRISEAFPQCHVCLVHHLNAAGTKMRGHSSVYAGLDQVMLVTKAEDSKIRTAVLDKQKDGEDGTEIKFELFQVEVGRRAADSKPITSCVCLPVGGSATARSEKKGVDRIRLNNERAVILEALKRAISEHGEKREEVSLPAIRQLPRSIQYVVNTKLWKQKYLEMAPDAGTVADNTINARMKRASDQFQTLRIIGRINPYVWLTGRAVGAVVEVYQDNGKDDGDTANPGQADMLAAPESDPMMNDPLPD